ncbi:MAG: hypothetical protein IPN79_06470 [Saprospiraceae bacterium]|nr:hypothetical protein [Saprospiraceae bacterium]
MMKNSAVFILCFILILCFGFLLKPFYVGNTLTEFEPIFDVNSVVPKKYNIDSVFLRNSLKNNDEVISEIKTLSNDPFFFTDINQLDEITDSLMKYYKDDADNALYKYSLILTETNNHLKIKSFKAVSLDTLFYCYNWTSQFKFLAKINDGNKSFLYNAIYDYWMLEIVKSLEEIVKRLPDQKFTIRYKSLSKLCETNGYSPNSDMSWLEKVLYNVENSRYSYIVGRFYLVFGMAGLVVICIFTLITFLAYYFLFMKIVYKFKNIYHAKN